MNLKLKHFKSIPLKFKFKCTNAILKGNKTVHQISGVTLVVVISYCKKKKKFHSCIHTKVLKKLVD